MNRETLSNFLDLVAFLMVTPDLYGRDNMARLSAHLLSAPRPSLKLILFWRRDKKASGIVAGFLGLAGLVSILSWIVALPVAFILGFRGSGPPGALKLAAWLGGPDPSHWLAYSFRLSFINILLLMILGEGGAFLISTLVLVCLFVIWVISKTLGYIWTTIGRLERIEGTMLAAGAVLFVCARLLVLGPYVWQTFNLGSLLASVIERL